MDIMQCGRCGETQERDDQPPWGGGQALFLPGVHLGLQHVLDSVTKWPPLRETMLPVDTGRLLVALDVGVHDAVASGTRVTGV